MLNLEFGTGKARINYPFGPRRGTRKKRVEVVGLIYIKYSLLIIISLCIKQKYENEELSKTFRKLY